MHLNLKLTRAKLEQLVDAIIRVNQGDAVFSPQLAEAIVSGGADDPLKSHRREITVVFLDLRGFTAYAETTEPEELMRTLGSYHAAMGELVLANLAAHFAGQAPVTPVV